METNFIVNFVYNVPVNIVVSGSLIAFYWLKSFFKFFKSEVTVFHVFFYNKWKKCKCFRGVLHFTDQIWRYINKVFIEFQCDATILFYWLTINIYWFRKYAIVKFTFSSDFFHCLRWLYHFILTVFKSILIVCFLSFFT